jgi:hypothetical protein
VSGALGSFSRLAAMTITVGLLSCDRGPPGPEVVATVGIAAARDQLVPDDSVHLTAVVRDAAGHLLHDVSVAWRTSDEVIATVDSAGMLRAHEPGAITVFAEARGVTGTAEFTVLGLRVDSTLVVVDSTQALLVSDSAEMEAGTLVFETVPGVRTPVVGEVLVGAQAGGFLRRVSAVNQVGNRMTVQTVDAALADVLDAGSLAVTVPIVSGAGPPEHPGVPVRLGPPRVEYALAPVQATDVGWSFAPIRIDLEVCPDEDARVSTCVTVALDLPNAQLSFNNASADIDVVWTWRGLRSARFILTGEAEWQSDVTLSLTAQQRLAALCRLSIRGSLTEPPTAAGCPTITRRLLRVAYPFLASIGPVPVVGDVILSVALEVSFDVSGGVSVTTHATVNAPVRAGLEWARRAGTNFIFEPTLSGAVTPPQVQLGAELGSRLALTPSLSLRFYRSAVGHLDLSGYVRATLGGSTAGDFQFGVFAGIETLVGARFDVLDRSILSVSATLFAKETLLVGIDVPQPPDLTIAATVAHTYSSAQRGVHIPVTVTRTGGDLTQGTHVTAGLYWSTNSQWDASDTLLWESNGTAPDFPNAVLNTESSRTVPAVVNIPTVSAGSYHILAVVDATNVHAESYELNNVRAFAVTVSSAATGDTIYGEISPPGEIDEYHFAGTAGQEVAVFLQGLSGSPFLAQFLTLDLLDQAGTVNEGTLGQHVRSPGNASTLTGNGRSTGRVVLPRTGTYTVRIKGENSTDAQGPYRAWIHGISRAAESASSAVAVGDTIVGEGVEPPGDVDEFTFTGTAGHEVAVFLQGQSGSSFLVQFLTLDLLDQAGTANEDTLGQHVRSPGNASTLTGNGRSTGRVILPRTGTYTVRVQGENSTEAHGPYRAWIHEINRAAENVSSVVTVGDTIAGEGIEPPGDVDEFTFSATAGQAVAVLLQGQSGSSFLSQFLMLDLLDQAGTVNEIRLGLHVRSPGNASTLEGQSTGSVTLPRTGTYTVRVQGESNDEAKGPYRFLVRAVTTPLGTAPPSP